MLHLPDIHQEGLFTVGIHVQLEGMPTAGMHWLADCIHTAGQVGVRAYHSHFASKHLTPAHVDVCRQIVLQGLSQMGGRQLPTTSCSAFPNIGARLIFSKPGILNAYAVHVEPIVGVGALPGDADPAGSPLLLVVLEIHGPQIYADLPNHTFNTYYLLPTAMYHCASWTPPHPSWVDTLSSNVARASMAQISMMAQVHSELENGPSAELEVMSLRTLCVKGGGRALDQDIGPLAAAFVRHCATIDPLVQRMQRSIRFCIPEPGEHQDEDETRSLLGWTPVATGYQDDLSQAWLHAGIWVLQVPPEATALTRVTLVLGAARWIRDTASGMSGRVDVWLPDSCTDQEHALFQSTIHRAVHSGVVLHGTRGVSNRTFCLASVPGTPILLGLQGTSFPDPLSANPDSVGTHLVVIPADLEAQTACAQCPRKIDSARGWILAAGAEEHRMGPNGVPMGTTLVTAAWITDQILWKSTPSTEIVSCQSIGN